MTAPAAVQSVGTVGTVGTSTRSKNGKRAGASGALTLKPFSPDTTPPAEMLEQEIERPTFVTHDDWFQLGGKKMRPGLYWHGYGKGTKDDPNPPVDIWICSPIHAVAMTTAEVGTDWGLLLRFKDPNHRWKEWAAPLRLLKGSGEDLRGELLDQGLRIDPDGNRLLTRWVMSEYPKRRITAAIRTGWHEGRDGRCFVLPGRTIGSEDVRFQAEHASHDDFTTAGSLKGWRDDIAALCEGNPVLLLAVSSAFAGPLLKVAKLQEVGGAGLNLFGLSSKGKTTALQAAASVYGAPSFIRTWRATANGIEAAAASLNDTLLILDEISECDPREIGAVVYSLANGTGKQRAARTGGVRGVARWRIMALSSGERTLDSHMGEGGKRAKAGQEARLLDVPATNRAHGAFDDLHGHPDGRAFADALKQASSAHYGHAGPAFVEHLLKDGRDLPGLLHECASHAAFSTMDGLEMRAADIFALCGLAGELATEYGITGWSTGAALKAAAELFHAWRDFRGGGQTESRRILESVRDFILAHGGSRFSRIDRDADSEIIDRVNGRAGYWRDDADGRTYLFFPAALQEAAPGFAIRQIFDALEAAGWIVDRDSPDRRTKKVWVPHTKSRHNLYAIRPAEEVNHGRS